MNNTIIFTFTVGAAYAPLRSSKLVGTVELSCPPTNIGVVNILDMDGNDTAWQIGETHTFKSVDLNQIQAKGNVGDTITVNGGTW